jgi:hypothetical protein
MTCCVRDEVIRKLGLVRGHGKQKEKSHRAEGSSLLLKNRRLRDSGNLQVWSLLDAPRGHGHPNQAIINTCNCLKTTNHTVCGVWMRVCEDSGGGRSARRSKHRRPQMGRRSIGIIFWPRKSPILGNYWQVEVMRYNACGIGYRDNTCRSKVWQYGTVFQNARQGG